MTTLEKAMTITFIHDGGGMVKFTPSISQRVWYDSYFDGKLIHSESVKSVEVADIILRLTDRGYYIELNK